MQRTFVRTVSSSRAKENTYKEFGKWITEVFNGDPTAEELDDIAAHDSDFDYVAVSVSAAPRAAGVAMKRAAFLFLLIWLRAVQVSGITPVITWNGQIVANNSLVSLSVVLPKVDAVATPQYPLLCQGITGGQWYQPSGAPLLLATDPVTTPDVCGKEVCQEEWSCIVELCPPSHMVFNVVPIPPSHSVLESATYGPNITGGVQFQLLTPTNVDPPVFQLTSPQP
ncbi:hypothetical protein EMCRGX_G019036 [Ephydatia muelleri]